MKRAFRERGALRRWELQRGPNMTPMVDVVMVILIFFMAATALLGPEWFLRSALPRQGAGGGETSDPFALPPARFDVSLAVDEGGRTVGSGLGPEAVGLDELEAQIAALGTDAAAGGVLILISASDEVPYRDVVRVHDACNRAGITLMGLAGGA